jgi:tetratricopeptide (TPR) repeat protein
MRLFFFLLTGFLFSFGGNAQTFTMAKKCNELNTAANGLLKEKKYQESLDAYTEMSKSCTTKDAKEVIALGKAEALNGLGKYEEAIEASNAALKITKNKSLGGYFQKAVAESKLNRSEDARNSFAKVIELTEKNQDTKSRASNYALMSAGQWRQLGNKDSGYHYIDKAIEMDPTNSNFQIQKGDMYIEEKKYDQAFVQYDKAVEMGRTDLDMYVIRSNARINMVQQKYNTTNTQELRSKMTPDETAMVCKELRKALDLGLKDMKQDMFAALVCK